MAVLGLISLGSESRRYWRWLGIAGSIVACVMWLIDIWIGAGSDLGTVIFCVLLSLAAVVPADAARPRGPALSPRREDAMGIDTLTRPDTASSGTEAIPEEFRGLQGQRILVTGASRDDYAVGL